ncbi:hypothetical protein D9615_008623 [Tricholomella constricta]|uniref:Uncharacterized protein n=1 Tax=Tricholomella constricta TaxID=117010 RepID=A0A8H5M076_9AGAR|nr:hypothetical protein D9615_008623 [Tricholomella constricta]
MFLIFFRHSISTLPPFKNPPAAARLRIHVDGCKYTTSQATLESAPLKNLRRRRRAEIPRIHTLDRNRLTPRDFVDLSNLTTSPIAMDSLKASIAYGHTSHLDYERHKMIRSRFPPDARGFLYYHQDPRLPLTAGEIRFRVTAGPDPALFDAGKDLLDPHGTFWSIHLLKLINSKIHRAFKEILGKDELLDPKFLRTIEKSWVGIRFCQSMRMLYYLEQPFEAILKPKTPLVNLRVVTPHAFDELRIHNFLVDYRSDIGASPYTVTHPGRLLLRFERSTLPEHAGSDVVVIRVLKILEPLKVVIPMYDMAVPMPCEGELLQIRYRNKNRPYSMDLNNPTSSMKALQFFALERL